VIPVIRACLTSCIGVEDLIVTQLVKKFPVCYGTRRSSLLIMFDEAIRTCQ